MLNVTAQTLLNWDKSRKLKPYHTTNSGRYYSQEQLNKILGVKDIPRKVIGYCRVSSHKQKDDLDSQVENMRTYLLAQCKPFEILTIRTKGLEKL